MKPRIRPSSYYSRTSDGVAWLGPGGLIKLTGSAIAELTERLAPSLTGSTSMDELTAGLSEQQAHVVNSLINSLMECGLVSDADYTSAPGGPNSTFAAWHDCSDERYRHGRGIAIGASTVVEDFREALAASGAEDVEVISDPSILHTSKPDYAVHIFSANDLDIAAQIEGSCADIPLVQVMIGGQVAIFKMPDGIGWQSVWSRLRQGDRAQIIAPTCMNSTAIRLLANQVCFLLYRAIIGVTSVASGSVTWFNGVTLNSTHHSVLLHPSVVHAATESPEEFRQAITRLRKEMPLDEEEFSRNVISAIDQRFGPILALDEGELPQIPVRQARAVLDTGTVVERGADFGGTRRRTALRALGQYAATAIDSRRLNADRKLWAWRPHDNGTCLVDADTDGYIAVGRNWSEMIADGLLPAVAVISAAADINAPLVPQDFLNSDPESRKYLRLLKALGFEPRLSDLTSATGIPSAAVHWNSGSHIASRLSFADAVRDVLMEASSGLRTTVHSLGTMNRNWSAPSNVCLEYVSHAMVCANRIPAFIPLDHDPAVAEIAPFLAKMVLCND